MDNDRIRKIGVIIIIFILFIMFTLTCISAMEGKISEFNIKLSTQKSVNDEKKKIDWEKIYPFQSNNNKEEKKHIIERIKEKLKSIENKIEKKTSDDIWMYEKFIEKSYLYDKAIMYTLVSNTNNNSRVRIGDYYCRLRIPINAEVNIEEKIQKVKEFNEFLSDRDINFLYIQAPTKIEKMSEIYQDRQNIYADILLKEIEGKVNYLDLRDTIQEKGEEYLKLFFKTDHHWKPQTAFMATRKIIEKLNDDYEYNINEEIICNIENYDEEIYKNAYLGSDGRYVTLANTDMEDISIITPKFDTKLTVKIPQENFNRTGTFKETLIDYKKLNKTYEYNTDCYAAYCHGDQALIEIHNENVKNNIKVLVIKDSFADSVVPYLALGIEDCSIIDLRSFTGSVKSYIEEYEPNLVLNLYYPGALNFKTDKVWTYQ